MHLSLVKGHSHNNDSIPIIIDDLIAIVNILPLRKGEKSQEMREPRFWGVGRQRHGQEGTGPGRLWPYLPARCRWAGTPARAMLLVRRGPQLLPASSHCHCHWGSHWPSGGEGKGEETGESEPGVNPRARRWQRSSPVSASPVVCVGVPVMAAPDGAFWAVSLVLEQRTVLRRACCLLAPLSPTALPPPRCHQPEHLGILCPFSVGVRARHHTRTATDQERQGQASGAVIFRDCAPCLCLAWPQERGPPSPWVTVFSRLCQPLSGLLENVPSGFRCLEHFSPVFLGLPHSS